MIGQAASAAGDQGPDEGIAALVCRKERLLGILLTFLHSCGHQLEVVHDSGECLRVTTPFVNGTLVLKRIKAIFNGASFWKLEICVEGCNRIVADARRFARQLFG